jgi:hypothetical protein
MFGMGVQLCSAKVFCGNSEETVLCHNKNKWHVTDAARDTTNRVASAGSPPLSPLQSTLVQKSWLINGAIEHVNVSRYCMIQYGTNSCGPPSHLLTPLGKPYYALIIFCDAQNCAGRMEVIFEQ